MSSSARRTVRVEQAAIEVYQGRLVRGLGLLAAALLLAGAALALPAALAGVAAAGCGLGAACALLAALVVLRARRREAGAVEVWDEGIVVELVSGRVTVPWAALARWRVQTRGDREEVTLERAGGETFTVRAPTDEETQTLVAALRAAEARRVATFPLCDVPGRRSARLLEVGGLAPLLVGAVVGAVFGAEAGWAFLVLGLGAYVWAAARRVSAAHPRGVVGNDGVAVVGAAGAQFVPYLRVAAVDWDEYGVVLELRDGTEVALPVIDPKMIYDPGDISRAYARRDALHERIRVELAAWRRREGQRGDGGAMLDRCGRTVEAWRAALHVLASEVGAGYRQFALDREEVASVIEDPGAPVERRVAAAFALSTRDDPAARRRVRVALEACASEPMRAAIDRAAHGDLDDLTLDRLYDAAWERQA